MSTGARGRPRASDSAATRATIIEAARRAFADHGYEATSLKAIAADAGLTAPAISHHFGSKRGLFVAVGTDAEQRLLAVLTAAVASADDFASRLHALAQAAARVHTEDPSITGFLSIAQIEYRRRADPDTPPLQGPVVALLTRVVRDAAAANEISSDADPGAVVALLLAMTLGVALYATVIDPEAANAVLVEFGRFVGGGLLVEAS
ncbi:MAG: TetR/AcrR family transcriptional regulator [Acidimicrobiia bacterium]|nr:TetR/AcrR family transcriptional regulator [Acidimicrobiia bacterium]